MVQTEIAIHSQINIIVALQSATITLFILNHKYGQLDIVDNANIIVTVNCQPKTPFNTW